MAASTALPSTELPVAPITSLKDLSTDITEQSARLSLSDGPSMLDDPLATTTSVPSSDDGHDDDSDNGADDNNNIANTASLNKPAEVAADINSGRSSVLQETTTSTIAPTASTTSTTANTSRASTPLSFNHTGQSNEPQQSLSRPLSRQDLRRKSSFFNSKDIAVSDRRYSPAAYDSLRPVADPRFKSRFQSILSEWKARASG
ncbi:hypothetical protein BGZ51_007932 [Haplosporangium sp. Z 767]|nr:hypothetical protein BGZ51_007932 [Haplosporangium sp. Z 767]